MARSIEKGCVHSGRAHSARCRSTGPLSASWRGGRARRAATGSSAPAADTAPTAPSTRRTPPTCHLHYDSYSLPPISA